MRIAYAKLGRSVLLDPKKYGSVGGDNEPLALLLQLAERNPDHTFVIAGRHSGDPGGLPANIEIPTYNQDGQHPNKTFLKLHSGDGVKAGAVHDRIRELYQDVDGVIMHLGQHGTSNRPTPQDKDPFKMTRPQDWSQLYAGSIIAGINDWINADPSREVTWLCQDPRNYLKARDLKWYPRLPILSQYDKTKDQKHFRWNDDRPPANFSREYWSEPAANGHWKSTHSYEYSGLELVGVPRWEDEDWPDFKDRDAFGAIINENRPYVSNARAPILQSWFLPLDPAFIHGKWSPKSLETLGREITSVPYDNLPYVFSRARTTFTTPASGSKWATAKPWEAFALGVICFFHPLYDAQGHIIPTLEQASKLEEDDPLRTLAGWLRARNPDELKQRVAAVSESEETYTWLRDQQYALLATARSEQRCVREIERRLGL